MPKHTPRRLDCKKLAKKLVCSLKHLRFYFRFKNRPGMTFDDVSVAADQEFQLHVDNLGTLEYSTK